jgi:hypothetical protein
VVALANGGFAAAWVDTPAGGSGVSVETRVFAAAGAPAASAPAATASVVTAPSTQVASTAVVGTSAISTASAQSIPDTPAAAPAVPAAWHPLATAGNNVLAAAGSGGALLDGQGGVDTVVFGGQRASYALTSDGTTYSVADTVHGVKTVLANVERLQFSDQSVAIDVNGHAGDAYRLYRAAFDRAPDKVGLGFWINAMDEGHTLPDVAAGFSGSAEFAAKYGANTSDAQYLNALYQNVLHRAPDAEGYDFWIHALENTSRAQLLVDFSQSTENRAQVADAIQNGIGYAPTLAGTAGKDVLAAGSAAWLDGKEGVDTVVFGGLRAAYSVTTEGANLAVADMQDAGKTLLANVERLQFGDQTVALDVKGNAGEAYRLYQAAFDRAPDKVGLGFWINALDEGHTLQDAAASFVGSAEFAGKYGANTSDAQYLQALYANVLHRTPDGEGYAFWLQALQNHTSRAQVLVDFSESPENQAQVIGAIQTGIDYMPWA